ncbi:MAG: PEP/pyruvate-binding domain-containing protein [Sphingomicrobium sp.]
MARTSRAGRYLELPQVMFAIDRNASPAKVHWINTRRYGYHFAFLQSRYLTLAESEAFNDANYSKPDRRFVLGSVVRYPALGRYGVELWEGDVIEPELLGVTMTALQESFHARLTFKPNSDQQAAAAREAGLPTIGIDEAYGSREQMVFNMGRAIGRLVLVARGQEDGLLPGDIALLGETPIRLPPVAGIVTSRFTTPINHVNLLAKSWRIPNAYRAGADRLWQGLAGQQVVLDTRGPKLIVRPASAAEIKAAQGKRAAAAVRIPEADVSYSGLPGLAEQDRQWSRRTGSKAANLAEVAALARERPKSGFSVPDGFSIPFAFYDRFVAANAVGSEIDAFLKDPRRADPAWRRSALAQLRSRFASGRIPETDRAGIVNRWIALLGKGNVFVRSSTNAEDLRGFNGAGLYDSVPNVRTEQALEAAVKTVWASLWNDRAFAAREAAQIDHRAVRAACLVQLGIDADSAGVMTTVDPFDEQNEERRVFIAAKRGLGIRVVEGQRVAEQLIYRPSLGAVQVLTRSQDDRMLHFAPDGGVEEIAIEPARAVLTDDLVRRLGRIGFAIEARFGGRPQDIEWLIEDGQIMIVQSRDYIRGS